MMIWKLGMNKLRHLFYKNKPATTEIFKKTIYRKLRSDAVVLNAGCGFHPDLHLKGKCLKVIGVDLDERIYQNDDLDIAIQGDISDVTLSSDTFDLIVGEWLIEHLEKPLESFRNLHRVLKNDSYLILLTSNRFHYVSIVAAITPYWFNKWFCKLIGTVEEAYPVYYRCNTPGKLRITLRQAGFEIEDLILIEPEPDYLKFSTATFLIGALLQFLLSSRAFKMFRRDMIGVFVKR